MAQQTTARRPKGTKMNRKAHHLRRMASLSALASAALAASGGPGEAAIIYHPTHGASVLPLPGGNQLQISFSGLFTFSSTNSGGRSFYGPKGRIDRESRGGSRTRGFRIAAGGVPFRTKEGAIALARKGQTFGQIGSGSGRGSLAQSRRDLRGKNSGVRYFYAPPAVSLTVPSSFAYSSVRSGLTFSRHSVRQQVSQFANASSGGFVRHRITHDTYRIIAGYGDQYALFRFSVGPQTDYGWLELDLGIDSLGYPIVTTVAYAYDNSGKPIRAGAIPEPKRLPLALGALALGAVGVREWRTRRAKPAT